jgi:large subunit ribosomal protein L7/L12
MASKNFEAMIDQIANMSVKDLSELIKALEETFGVSAAAPVAAAPAAVAAAPAAEEKSQYKVTLKDSGAEKIKVIKALRVIKPELALGDAKNAVENTPFVVAEAASKDDAKKMKTELEAAGAKVELA